jgi:hypothetical protein
MTIHILDDDSLLNIFYLYRPALYDGDEDGYLQFKGGKRWDRERWWYQLAHVCQRWRNLIHGSASYLGLCLVRLRVYDLEDFMMAIDEEYPVLEYLILEPREDNESMALKLPETLQAPHLRHLLLGDFSLPIGSRLLATAVGLATLALVTTHPISYFEPNSLLQCLLFVPQLEKLLIVISYPVSDSDVERQLMHTPITTSVTLTNLLCFDFQGANAYVEAVIRHITASRLERIRVRFFDQPSFSAPSLLQIVNTTKNLTGFECAHFKFSKDRVHVSLGMYHPMVYAPSPEEAKMCNIPSKVLIIVDCWGLDEQVSSMVQIFNSPGQLYSTVEHLSMEHTGSSGAQNEADHMEWRKLLRSFSNVKTLRVNDGLAKLLSLSTTGRWRVTSVT